MPTQSQTPTAEVVVLARYFPLPSGITWGIRTGLFFSGVQGAQYVGGGDPTTDGHGIDGGVDVDSGEGRYVDQDCIVNAA